jgi:hypothetical protein
MATNFPNSPSNGATHVFGGTTYTYNSTKGVWTADKDAVAVSDTPPSNPETGALWFDSSVAKTYIYYNDGSSSQWVQLNPSGGSDGADATGDGESPIIYTEPPTSHNLSNNGSTSTVQMQAVDPEGTAITYGIAYANSTNALPTQLSSATTIDQSTGTYTFTPSTTQANAGTFKARLSASDGITSATRFVNFSLSFTHTLYYLVIAGGGGGGGSSSGLATGGGGGAGGYLSSWNNESSGGGAPAESPITGAPGDVYTITVGAGGAGAIGSNAGSNGANSSIARTGITTITAVGGGYGGSSSGVSGASGGSGGGGQPYNGTAVGSGTANQGYDGGNGYGSGGDYSGGGGGGAGAVGASASSGTGGANGGVGVASTITGTSVYRAGGGGGGDWAGPDGGTGGNGGGGDGNQTAGSNGTNGTPNTGGGGGGGGATSSYTANGGDGGSGVVIIRSSTQAASTTGSPVETTDGSDYIYQFNADGTITF